MPVYGKINDCDPHVKNDGQLDRDKRKNVYV